MSRLALVLAVICVGGLTAGVSPALGAFPGHNGKIAFDSDRQGGDIDIWTMNPNSRKLANLTAGSKAHDQTPSWRADGRKVVFMSDRKTARNPTHPGFPGPDFEIFVMNANGSKPRQLTFNDLDDEDPAWSPEGGTIVFRRDFIPARGKVADDILTMKADGTEEKNLTSSPVITDGQPNWSPNGAKIAFTSDRDGDNEIYKMSPDGSNVQQLTINVLDDEYPNWSPDGRRITFNRERRGNFDVYAMRAGGGSVKRLTFHPAGDGLPAWSPDGRRIAFASDRDRSPNVFTMRADGRGQLNRTNSEAFNTPPTGSRDDDDDDDDDHGDHD